MNTDYNTIRGEAVEVRGGSNASLVESAKAVAGRDVQTAARDGGGGRPGGERGLLVDGMPPRAARIDFQSAQATSAATFWGRLFLLAISAIWAASPAIGFEGGVTALTVLGFLTAFCGLRRPVLGLYGAALLCTLDAVMRTYLMTGGGLLRWNSFNYLLLLVTILNAHRFLRMRARPLHWHIALLGLLFVQLSYSAQLTDGVQHIFGAASLYGLLIYWLDATRDRKVWTWCALVAGITSGLGGLAFQVLEGGAGDNINPNAYVHFPLTGTFAICLGFWASRDKPRMQLILLGLAIVNTGWVFLSASRGGLLMSLCCIFFLVKSMRNLSHRATILFVGGLMAVLVSSYFAEHGAYTIHRLKRLVDSDASMSSRTSGRSELVVGGWHAFLRNPLLGVGTGSFASEYSKISLKNNLSFKKGKEIPAHSGWIKILAENGIFGFLLLLGFVFSFAYTGWTRRQNRVWPIGLLVTLVFGVALISTEFQAKGLWFLAAGAIVLLYQRPGGRVKRAA